MGVAEEWGLRCPHCGSDEGLKVACLIWARLDEDGTETDGDHEWDKDSGCLCDCGWIGLVSEAEQAEKKNEKRL